MQQYDVQVEWQTVQHYLRRGASEIVLASSQEQEVLSNLARPSVASRSVVSPNVVLPNVAASRICGSSGSRILFSSCSCPWPT